MGKDKTRYWLRVSGLPWQEATIDQFIAAERAAGFHPKTGNGVATSGFGSGAVEGKTTDGEITEAKRYDEAFVAIANATVVKVQ